EYATGVKLVENSVRAAMGLPIIGIEQKPYNGCWAEVILHSDKAGVFDSLWISDEIQGAVYERDLWIEPGTPVGGFSAANEAIGTLVLRFENEDTLQKVMADIPSHVKVCLR
ncbi:MAG: carboxylate--amine ligase, partial [Clostridia bacterium]|nr:carboxylate--amine ligase [Clostridia bacterium]